MSKRIYITFGGAAYDETTARIVADAPKFGVDEVKVYDDRWLIEKHNADFIAPNRWLWDTQLDKNFNGRQFGFGWCCWKPLIILDALSKAEEGDLVLYTDADTYPVADLSPIFEFAERDRIVLFQVQGCLHERFTRRDCFVTIGIENPDEYAKTIMQGCGRFQIFRKESSLNLPFLEMHVQNPDDYAKTIMQVLGEWLKYSTTYDCQRLDPSPNEFPGYHRHSNEQSILSILAIKYGIKGHREACQNGWPALPGQGRPEDTYPQLFHQQWCGGDKGDLRGSRFRNVE